MKKLFILSIVALLSFVGTANAYNYCVSFPTSGNSKWSKRDNYMQVRMGVDYSVDRTEARNGGIAPDYFTEYFSKRIRMWDGNDFSSSDYFRRWYGSSKRCFNMDKIAQSYGPIILSKYGDVLDHQNGHWLWTKSGENVKFNGFFIDVRWGKDCPKVKNDKDYNFSIYRRKHNHANPWGCS